MAQNPRRERRQCERDEAWPLGGTICLSRFRRAVLQRFEIGSMAGSVDPKTRETKGRGRIEDEEEHDACDSETACSLRSHLHRAHTRREFDQFEDEASDPDSECRARLVDERLRGVDRSFFALAACEFTLL